METSLESIQLWAYSLVTSDSSQSFDEGFPDSTYRIQFSNMLMPRGRSSCGIHGLTSLKLDFHKTQHLSIWRDSDQQQEHPAFAGQQQQSTLAYLAPEVAAQVSRLLSVCHFRRSGVRGRSKCAHRAVYVERCQNPESVRDSTSTPFVV